MNGWIAVLLDLAAVALTGTAGPQMADRTAGDLRLQLSVSRSTYRVGEAVATHMRVSNVASTPVGITSYSGQQFDVLVRQRGALIWQWSHDKAFVQVVRESTMPPGESLSFDWTWDQRDLQGRQVEPGTYDLSAVFLGAQRGGPRSIEVGPIRVTIGR